MQIMRTCTSGTGFQIRWVDDAARASSREICLKSSEQTFFGTVFVLHKTCATTVVCRRNRITLDLGGRLHAATAVLFAPEREW
jgi:hypothetical protein